MDFTGMFAAQFLIMAIVLMAVGAFGFWVLTSVLPYLWQHLHWVN